MAFIFINSIVYVGRKDRTRKDFKLIEMTLQTLYISWNCWVEFSITFMLTVYKTDQVVISNHRGWGLAMTCICDWNWWIWEWTSRNLISNPIICSLSIVHTIPANIQGWIFTWTCIYLTPIYLSLIPTPHMVIFFMISTADLRLIEKPCIDLSIISTIYQYVYIYISYWFLPSLFALLMSLYFAAKTLTYVIAEKGSSFLSWITFCLSSLLNCLAMSFWDLTQPWRSRYPGGLGSWM